MGAWGSSLYANDVTCDIKDVYTKFLQEQLSNEDAFKKTIEKFHEYVGDDDEPLFWYALADTQWRLGRLMPKVKENALSWIDKIGGIALWEDSKNGGLGWKRTLEKLKKQLESPMPPEKLIKKPVEFIRNHWNVGDVYAYQFHSELSKDTGLFGKYILLQKVADVEWCDGLIFSLLQTYDKVFDKLPIIQDLNGVRILPFDSPEVFISGKREANSLSLNALMIQYKKREYSEKHYTFIGNKLDNQCVALPRLNRCDSNWDNIEDFLCDYYNAWLNYEYEVKNGKSYVRLK